jgi:hypothetical protein
MDNWCQNICTHCLFPLKTSLRSKVLCKVCNFPWPSSPLDADIAKLVTQNALDAFTALGKFHFHLQGEGIPYIFHKNTTMEQFERFVEQMFDDGGTYWQDTSKRIVLFSLPLLYRKDNQMGHLAICCEELAARMTDYRNNGPQRPDYLTGPAMRKLIEAREADFKEGCDILNSKRF